jgi:hypothetical protein
VWGASNRFVFSEFDLASRLASLAIVLDCRQVKQVELKRRIQRAAQARRIQWQLVRQGGRHEVWQCGRTKVTIPRHREINEITAQSIFTTLEAELGTGWWKR